MARNITSATLASGGSTSVSRTRTNSRNITQADLFPMRTQNTSDIEGKNNGNVNFLQFPKDRA